MIEQQNKEYSLKRIRLAIFAFYFSQGLVFSSWASRIPDIKASLGINDAVLGTMLLMISVGQMIGMTMSGFLVSKLGSKKILLTFIPFYGLILLPIALAHSQYLMMIFLVFYGLFANFMNISVNTQGINIETLYGRSIMSSFHGGWSIAGFLGSLIGLAMINLGVNPFQHFLIINVIVAVILLCNHKYLLADVRKETPLTESGTETKKNKPEKFLYLLGLVAFSGMFVEGTMFDWSGVYFKDIVGAPHSLVPLGFACFMMMMATGRFIADRSNEKLGRRRTIQLCGSLATIGLIIAVFFPNIIITPIAFMIIGLGVSGIVPTIYSLAGQKTKIPTSLALTVVSSISFLGFLMGPPLIGYISEATNLRYSYGFATLFAVLIVILASNIKVFKKSQ